MWGEASPDRPQWSIPLATQGSMAHLNASLPYRSPNCTAGQKAMRCKGRGRHTEPPVTLKSNYKRKTRTGTPAAQEEQLDCRTSHQMVSNFNMHTNPLQILLKCRFCFSQSGVESVILHFQQAPRRCWCPQSRVHTASSQVLNSIHHTSLSGDVCSKCLFLMIKYWYPTMTYLLFIS